MTKKGQEPRHLKQIEYNLKRKIFIFDPAGPKTITEDVLKKAKILLEIIADETGVKFEQILQKNRKREFTQSRFIFYAIMKEEFKKMSLIDLGSFFAGAIDGSGQDHATVLNAVKTYNNLLDTDKSHQALVKAIKFRWYKDDIKEEELLDCIFSLEEVKGILAGNGVANPRFTKDMFPKKFHIEYEAKTAIL